MRIAFALVVLLTACGEEKPKAYPTYNECFDDLALVQMVPVIDAIVECCHDHEIGGVERVCLATMPDCINYLTANLRQCRADTVQVRDACTLYADLIANPPPPEN
jgi:hypothetical protein